MNARILTAEEVAERLGKSPKWWLDQARKQKVPHRRIGRTVGFTEDDLDEFLSRSRVDVNDPLKSAVPARRRRSA